MFNVSLDMTGFHNLEHKVANTLRIGVAEAAKRGAISGRDEARAAPFKDRSGRLRSGIVARLVGSSVGGGGAFGVDWEFESMADYSWFVEFPTKAHWIRPREARGFVGPLHENQTRRNRAPHYGPAKQGEEYARQKTATDNRGRLRALKFFIAGQTVFAAKVWHPGTRGIPFMHPGREAALLNVTNYLEQVANDLGNL